MGKLKVEDLDSILQGVYEVGCELQTSMERSIKDGDDAQRTVLNITGGLRDNYDRPIRKMLPSEEPPYDLEEFTVGYEKEFGWTIGFSYKDENNQLKNCFGYAVDGSEDDVQPVIERAQRIAGELEQIYKLPYNISILRDGEAISGAELVTN